MCILRPDRYEARVKGEIRLVLWVDLQALYGWVRGDAARLGRRLIFRIL